MVKIQVLKKGKKKRLVSIDGGPKKWVSCAELVELQKPKAKKVEEPIDTNTETDIDTPKEDEAPVPPKRRPRTTSNAEPKRTYSRRKVTVPSDSN